jgi:hypothetical protein
MNTIDKIETSDEVIVEIRRTKENLARKFDFDIDRIIDDARIKQDQSIKQIISPPNTM